MTGSFKDLISGLGNHGGVTLHVKILKLAMLSSSSIISYELNRGQILSNNQSPYPFSGEMALSMRN
jgi:hypothetical protein